MIDSQSTYFLKTGCRYPMVEHQTSTLNAAGAPWEMRMTDDFFDTGWQEHYKLYIFPVLFAPSTRVREKIASLQKSGACTLFMHAPGYITEDDFSEFAMESLTGIRLKRVELTDNTIIGEGEFAGIQWGFTNKPVPGDVTVKELHPFHVENVTPVFAAENLDIVFGRFRETGEPACGIKFRPGGGFDAFSACAPVPLEIV